MADGRWVAYVGASDWIGPTDEATAADFNGSSLADEMQARARRYLSETDLSSIAFDPESDGVGLVGEQWEPIVSLVRGMRRDGLLFGDASAEASDLVVFSPDDEAQVQELPPPAVSELPAPIMGPYPWGGDPALRGFFSTWSRLDWHGIEARVLFPRLQQLLAAEGLVPPMELHVDGPEGFALDGATRADFEKAARALGLDGVDDS